MNDNRKFLAVSLVAGILSANRTSRSRWSETAARQALGLVNEVEKLLNEETALRSQAERNLTKESVKTVRKVAGGQKKVALAEIAPTSIEAISFSELTKRLDPTNRNRKQRREASFREFLSYQMKRNLEAQRLSGDEDLPVDGGLEPSTSSIDEKLERLKGTRFVASAVQEIQQDYARFRESVKSLPQAQKIHRPQNSRKKGLDHPVRKIAKSASRKRSK